VELALVVQRRLGDPVGIAAVTRQLAGQVVEGVAERPQRVTEAGQMTGQALLERLPALLLPDGLACRRLSLFQRPYTLRQRIPLTAQAGAFVPPLGGFPLP